MRLDDRLQAVADFVPSGCRVADIGTDHAYLAIELYKKDSSRFVIAADKNAGPCDAARRTIREAGLADAIEVRQGDGLGALKAGEVNTVCIAGMGGKLIADILEAQPEIFEGLEYAVLQPQNAALYLRQWLYEHGWHIEDERLSKADGRIYQIMLARPGETAMPGQMELFAGPVILRRRQELFSEYIKGLIEGQERIAAGLRQASSSSAADGLSRVTEQIIKLKELLTV